MQLPPPVHKAMNVLDWAWGGAVAVLGQSAPAPSTINLGDWNTRVGLIVLGVGLIGARVADVLINFYARKKTIDSESYIGKFNECKETLERERAAWKEQRAAILVNHRAELDRSDRTLKEMSRDCEERIANKRLEIEYLHGEVEKFHDLDGKKTAMVEAAQAALLHAQAKMIEQAERSNANYARSVEVTRESVEVTRESVEVSKKSVDNTGAALRLIPPADEHPPVIEVIQPTVILAPAPDHDGGADA